MEQVSQKKQYNTIRFLQQDQVAESLWFDCPPQHCVSYFYQFVIFIALRSERKILEKYIYKIISI